MPLSNPALKKGFTKSILCPFCSYASRIPYSMSWLCLLTSLLRVTIHILDIWLSSFFAIISAVKLFIADTMISFMKAWLKYSVSIFDFCFRSRIALKSSYVLDCFTKKIWSIPGASYSVLVYMSSWILLHQFSLCSVKDTIGWFKLHFEAASISPVMTVR